MVSTWNDTHRESSISFNNVVEFLLNDKICPYNYDIVNFI